MQKIWISGANGQIGKAINKVVDKLNYEILNTDIDTLDITNTDEVLSFGEVNRPDIIINCAGYTDVYECEENPKQAYRINGLGARNMSIIARKLEAKLVHISTDDVFDGTDRESHNEYDRTNPRTVYGKSKLAGENYVKEFTSKHFIIRSTWVYGEGNNFVRSVIDKAQNGETLAIAAEHMGSPTSATELAGFILHIIETSEYGIYHVTNRGVCSRYEFAKTILKMAGINANVKAVPTKVSDFSAVRPTNAVLDNFVLSLIETYEMPEWKKSLREYINELMEKRGKTNE